MNLLGYAIFSGKYGDFTVPVIDAPSFVRPPDYQTADVLVPLNLYNSIHWNTVYDIASLNPIPQVIYDGGDKDLSSQFTCKTYPATALFNYVSGESGLRMVDFMRAGSVESVALGIDIILKSKIPCFFRFYNLDNKFYFAFGSVGSNGATFTFNNEQLEDTRIETVDILNYPVVIKTGTVEKPDNIVIQPYPAYIDLYGELQMRAAYKYNDGTEIPVNSDNGTWSLVDDSGDELNISGLTITENGLIKIGYAELTKFNVKVTWIGEEYNVTKTSPVYIADSPIKEDIYTPGIGSGNPSIPSGGGGNFGIDPSTGQPVQSDDIAPSLPGIGSASGSYEGSVSNAGLFVHYAMDATMLKVVGDWLWADNLGLIIAREFLSILYGSPIESAISLMSYPFNVTALPGVISQMQQMYWGSHAIGETLGGIQARAITNPYATIDWGTVQLTEFWGNFLDYAPHTKIELYLPWCTGFVPIDPNECLPGSLRVVTNIELAKGTCLHNVIGNDGRVIATHTGTCGKQLPLTALDTSGKALALVGGAAMAAVVGGAALAGGTTNAIYGGFDVAKLQGPYGQRWIPYDKPGNISTALEGAKAGAGMAAKASKKPAVMAAAAGLRANVSVPRNGTFTGSTAGLGVQYPYLIISRPTQSVPKQYGHHYGYPSNIYAPLLTLRGYTEIGEIHLTGFTCTEDELTEIDSLLKSGVIL